MIDARELRVGNWIRWKDNQQVFETSVGLFLEYPFWKHLSKGDYEAIPLSPDILEKCGFKKLKGSRSVFFICHNDMEISVSIELHYAYIDTFWGQASIKEPIFQYLHQLQNLYHSLTNQELNIQL